jgi:ABC-type branched-subunit amino acid transport system ATPase component
VSKRFAATQALQDVSLDLAAGEIHGLVGENGAGKSTIVKVFAGIHQPDSGNVILDGKAVLLHGPAHARSLGMAVVHQEPRLFPDLTVAENVFMGHAPTGGLGTVNWREMRQSADRIFESLSVHIDSGEVVRGLSMADQQLIEIAKALSIDARVLILDEPTASLSTHEVERLFAIVRQTRDRGVDINGGKGTVPGVILAVFILATLKSALTQAGISTDCQSVAIGLLLIVSVITPLFARQARDLVRRVRVGRRRPARDPAPGEVIR